MILFRLLGRIFLLIAFAVVAPTAARVASFEFPALRAYVHSFFCLIHSCPTVAYARHGTVTIELPREKICNILPRCDDFAVDAFLQQSRRFLDEFVLLKRVVLDR